jgi:hypothetical protein
LDTDPSAERGVGRVVEQKSVAEKVKEEKEKKGKEKSHKTHGEEAAIDEARGGAAEEEAWAVSEDGVAKPLKATDDGGEGGVGGGAAEWSKAVAKVEFVEQEEDDDEEEEVDWETRYNYASDGDGAKIYSTSKVSGFSNLPGRGCGEVAKGGRQRAHGLVRFGGVVAWSCEDLRFEGEYSDNPVPSMKVLTR